MSSITILKNPKAYANGNFNKVQLYALQDLTNPVAGNILVSDALGNFTSQSGGGAGFVTSVTGTAPAINITGTATAPNVVATGNFTGVALSTTAGLSVSGGITADSESLSTGLIIGPSVNWRYNTGAPIGSVLTAQDAIDTIGWSAPVTSGSMTQNLVAPLTLADGVAQSGCSIALVPVGTYLTSWSADLLVYQGGKVEARLATTGTATFSGGQSAEVANPSGALAQYNMSNSGLVVVSVTGTISISFLQSGAGGGNNSTVRDVTSVNSFPGATALTLIRIL